MDFEKERIAGLLKELKNGNKEVFEEFYKLTSPRAYFIALKIVRNEHDAEDILQESYIKLLENIDDIDVERNFTAWFYKIVANKSKDFLKKQKLLVFEDGDEEIIDAIPEENPHFSPEESLNQEELCSEVMAAIDELTAEKRACIMMMYFGEMSVNEIAESLEVPVSTVKNRLFTARKDLKNKFEKRGSTVLYSAAPIGVVAWALGKSSQAVSASFAASAASAEILAGVGAAGGITAAASAASAASTTAATAASATSAASATAATATSATAATAAATATTAAASTAVSTAAATGAGVAAKVAALSVAQKVVIGAVAAGVVGGSTAGVATVVKDNAPPPTTTGYIVEEVTTAPSQTTEFAFAFYETETTEESTTETTKREPTATRRREKTTEEKTQHLQTEKTTVKATTRRSRAKTTLKNTTKKSTTTEKSTLPSTTQETTEATTRATTTERVTTTKAPTTAKPVTTKVTTTKPTTTQPTTVKETATEPVTQLPATLIIEVTDFDNSVVDTITVNVDAGTQMTRDYLVALVSSNGYEAMAGVYGDAIGSAAQAGQTYTFTAEL